MRIQRRRHSGATARRPQQTHEFSLTKTQIEALQGPCGFSGAVIAVPQPLQVDVLRVLQTPVGLLDQREGDGRQALGP